MKELSAKTLKETLWETLNEIKDGKMEAVQADAIAAQAREILRTVNMQLRISSQAGENIAADLSTFNDK